MLNKAAEKIVKFNSDLTFGAFGFTVLYPDRTKVINLPGSEEPFTLEKYKKDIGKAYIRLTFYICKTEDYLEFLCRPSYCSDSDPDFDIIDKVLNNLKIKRDLPGKLKFDWNSTSHQSGTEELHERARASYLGNIQRNRECEQEHGTEEFRTGGNQLA